MCTHAVSCPTSVAALAAWWWLGVGASLTTAARNLSPSWSCQQLSPILLQATVYWTNSTSPVPTCYCYSAARSFSPLLLLWIWDTRYILVLLCLYWGHGAFCLYHSKQCVELWHKFKFTFFFFWTSWLNSNYVFWNIFQPANEKFEAVFQPCKHIGLQCFSFSFCASLLRAERGTTRSGLFTPLQCIKFTFIQDC